MIRPLTLAACLTAAAPAHAGLGGASGGIWGDAGLGLGAGDRPFTPAVGWTVALGGFVGRHDDVFAVGRRWGVGLRARQDAQFAPNRELLRTAVMLDVHRALDLFVATVQIGGLAGPLFTTPLSRDSSSLSGATVRVTGAATWRAHRFVGLQLRLDAGVDLDTTGPRVRPAPALGLTLGMGWAAPTRGGTAGP